MIVNGMRWLTDTLKIVLVSVFSFSAAVVLMIVSFSRDPQPLSVSVVVPPLAEKSSPESSTGLRAGNHSSPDPHGIAVSSPEKDEGSLPEPADFEKITLTATTPTSTASSQKTSETSSVTTSKTALTDDDSARPVPDKEGSVQTLTRGQGPPTKRQLKGRSPDQLTREHHQVSTKRPVLHPHSVSDSPFEDRQTFDELAALIGSDTAPDWLRYAATPSSHGSDQPFIAIVMDDFGLNNRALKQVSKLPGPLTISFLPYADDLSTQTAAMRHAGHEVMVHVPMQPHDRSHDPGPNVLDGSMNEEDILVRLDWALSRFDGYVGINNHMGSAFTTDPDGMRVVMSSLARRGLLFLDSVTSPDTLGSSIAESSGIPHVRRHIFLDHQRDSETINAQLDALENIARRRGYAVGIGHPHQNTIAALASWLPTLRQKGIALASVAHVVMRHRAAHTVQSAVVSEASAFY